MSFIFFKTERRLIPRPRDPGPGTRTRTRPLPAPYFVEWRDAIQPEINRDDLGAMFANLADADLVRPDPLTKNTVLMYAAQTGNIILTRELLARVLDSGVRVAIHYSATDSFAQNIVAGGVIGDPPYTPVSAGPANAAANSIQTQTIILPLGKTCDFCTLQWVCAANADGGSYVGWPR